MKKTLLFIILFTPFFLQAQPGTLDKSFGDTGIVFNEGINGLLNKIALQSDGKIIGAGKGSFAGLNSFLIIRYNTDGSIDSSFGNNGVSGIQDFSEVIGLAVNQDNSIIILGHPSYKVGLLRFKQDGSIDSTFGISGSVITSVSNNANVPVDVCIQADKKIVVGGYIINDPNQARQLFLIRYLPDGSLDNSFGNGGIVILGEPNGDKSFVSVNSLAMQPNGQILVGAIINVGVVYRFNTDGSLDSSFGKNGLANFQQSDNIVKSFVASALAVQPDGKIVGGGSSLKNKFNTTFTYMSAARINADGSIDSSFGANGLCHVEFGKDAAEGHSVLLQKDGEVIVTGWHYDDEYFTHGDFALARFRPDGSIDSTFGENGLQSTSIDFLDYGSSSVLQKDEKIILGGYSNSHILLARYNNDLTKKQIIFTRIRKWIQHHNGIIWDNVNGVSNYAIQRSSNGVNWSTIQNEAAIHHSPLSIHNYYEDPSPLNGTNYYRLQTATVDGAVAYSNVIVISNTEIKISPNPAKNVLNIEGLSSIQNLPAGMHGTKISVVDISGNIKLQVIANATTYNLNIASLKAGNYLVKIETNGEVVTKQFVKE